MEEGKKIYDCVFNLGKLAPNDHKQYYNLLFQQDNQQLRQEYEKYKKNFYHYEFVNFDLVFLTIE